ncbi:fe2+ zn2+ uptake regulation protein [Pseudomonas sp. UBA4194]|jgi:Fe2+ or Zn2+ uptake regulation protein|uniref:fe2+ zn2+ uptake regulation protein n=1 Tax=Pseudomonas sp. UBA4194 TaxID=1947317 RepID=UPI0025D0CCC6|nr:fe2+ zn2+ uptake regulation protein [Pseudomonas sp. UBA4194]
MQNSSHPTPGTRAGPAQPQNRTQAHDNSSNEQIKELLRTYGLRTSLIRLKVIDALHGAAREGQNIGVRGVHSQLEKLDIPLSFLSVREVLKRLCAEGVITLNTDKTYSLDPAARQMLD